MTATNEQIIAEARRRWDQDWPPRPFENYVIEVTREGWKPPEPVDPDLLAYREWEVGKHGTRDFREEVLAGKWDRSASAIGFLAGARMAREQEQERAKALEGLLREIEPYSNFIPWFDLQNRFDALLKEAAQ
jgi:hypothetical protein